MSSTTNTASESASPGTPKLPTLGEILAANPEWANLPVAVVRGDGYMDYVGASAAVFVVDDAQGPVVAFSAN